VPDEATTRDVALKLEAWAASLSESERRTVESWMALGTQASEPITTTRWCSIRPGVPAGPPPERRTDPISVDEVATTW
jgi:hypothetical protein